MQPAPPIAASAPAATHGSTNPQLPASRKGVVAGASQCLLALTYVVTIIQLLDILGVTGYVTSHGLLNRIPGKPSLATLIVFSCSVAFSGFVLWRFLARKLGQQDAYNFVQTILLLSLLAIITLKGLNPTWSTPGKYGVGMRPFVQVRGDSSGIVKHLTFPHGAEVPSGSTFEKVWLVANLGKVDWVDRYVERVGEAEEPSDLRSLKRTRLPYVRAGDTAVVRVSLIAPQQPGPYLAYFKIADENGRAYFPDLEPLKVRVNVP